MSNSIAILNGNQIYMDELIRENAWLTVQHKVDEMEMAELEEHNSVLQRELDRLGVYADVQEDVVEHKRTKRMLDQAIKDLHFVMAGGDPCKVCTVKCVFGAGECKPVWQGEELAETEEAADQ